MARTWMRLLAGLLVTLTLATTCSGDDSTSSLSSVKSAPPLQRRFQPSEVHALPGTDLTLKLYIGRPVNKVPFVVEYKGMAPELARFVEGLAVDQDDWNLPQFDFWPSSNYNLKLELRRTVPDCEDPPINAALLTAISGFIMDLATHWDRDYEFTAAIMDAQGAYFTLRVFASKALSSEQRSGENFDDGDLNTIFSTKKQILRWTNRRDLVLFLGNTASYFFYAFNEGDNRNAQLIPYSGKPYDQGRAPSLAQLDAFASSILRPAFSAKPFNRVVLVDHARTGQSLIGFAKVLKTTGVYMDRPYLINLAYPSWNDDAAFDDDDTVIKQLTRIPVGEGSGRASFERLDLGHVGRILPYYSSELWETPWQQAYNPDSVTGEATVQRIQARLNDRVSCTSCSCLLGMGC